MMPTTKEAVPTDPVALLDLKITMGQKRRAWLQNERRRQVGFHLSWLVGGGRSDDPRIDCRLVDRLDGLIAEQERKLADLESERSAVMLATIEVVAGRAS